MFIFKVYNSVKLFKDVGFGITFSFIHGFGITIAFACFILQMGYVKNID